MNEHTYTYVPQYQIRRINYIKSIVYNRYNNIITKHMQLRDCEIVQILTITLPFSTRSLHVTRKSSNYQHIRISSGRD